MVDGALSNRCVSARGDNDDSRIMWHTAHTESRQVPNADTYVMMFFIAYVCTYRSLRRLARSGNG